MDVYRIIETLYEEKKRLDRLIESLEELKRTGTEVNPRKLRKRRGRKGMSAEERMKVSERMKQYWAEKRSGSAGQPGGEAALS